jgi:hypothetical protein
MRAGEETMLGHKNVQGREPDGSSMRLTMRQCERLSLITEFIGEFRINLSYAFINLLPFLVGITGNLKRDRRHEY